MGNTIRREPVTSKIPASPDYKFLNITDFRGLDVSDNPFILKTNTASDLLNVYVDEDNALSTRPRLEKTHDVRELIGDGELINIYNISDGFLIHIKNGEDYMMYKHSDENGTKAVIGDIPTQKCSVFEKGDVVYLLDKMNYYALKDTTIGFVEPYIPTTIVGGTLTTTGSALEPLNVLSDKYKESYFWETFEMPVTNETDVVDVENTTYGEHLFDESLNGYFVLNYHNKKIAVLQKSDNKVLIGSISDDFSDVSFEETEITLPYIGGTLDGKILPVKNNLGFYVFTPIGANCVYVKETSSGLKQTTINLSYENRNTVTPLVASNNGECLLFWDSAQEDNNFLGYDTTEHARFSVTYDSEYRPCAPTFIGNDLYLVEGGQEMLYFGENFVVNKKIAFKKNIHRELDNIARTIVPYETGLIVLDSTGNGVYVDLETDDVAIIYTDTKNFGELYDVFGTSGGVIGKTSTISYGENATRENALFVIQEKNGLFTTHFTGIRVDDCVFRGDDDVVVSFKYDELNDLFYVAKSSKDGKQRFSLLSKKDTKHPQLVYTKKITNFEDKQSVTEAREKFFDSFLVKRFENNWWFASGNTLFRTENNDPTFIPIDVISEIGDAKEHITGMNLAEDDLLLVYKKNNIFAIQPVEYAERAGYSVLETKNVSGNNGYGATIVTALTEKPVHVSYDGIYALNQLHNVQSSDRIATLLSENINKKWLQESKDIIDNCQTINRLYWTYFVLKEKELTKIYLLDNRTSSWFYWELPIETQNVFVKDNTTMFVDVFGKVYKLTTEDIINEYNPDTTEYYDDGKKLINWYWKSQILPLSTINYSKKLVDTTFIVADTDASDEFGLNYKFRAYRKFVSESTETTITNRLNYIQSTTKKTLVPRFNFLQLEIFNVEDDLNNNRLRLLGLGLKYVLLEGLL